MVFEFEIIILLFEFNYFAVSRIKGATG